MDDIINSVEISPQKKYFCRWNFFPCFFLIIMLMENVAVFYARELNEILTALPYWLYY
jgi:hypothetical protein